LEIPFSLPSAKSSFLKAIDKMPPSDRTQEFKDGVLWADCAGLLTNDDVCLITADKAFFQERDYTKGLSRNLAAEIADWAACILASALSRPTGPRPSNRRGD